MDFSFYQKLAVEKKGNKIVLLVLDGLGGLPYGEMGQTELEVAQTPELDALARRSSLGLLDPVAPGITPGSGPGHLALFGYDPVEFQVGRGVLAALGIGFSLEPKDVACRINFCTLDEKGVITDRRAGRISTDECRRRVEKLKNIRVDGAELFIEPVMDYRAVLVLRGEGLSGDLEDTDPQITGVPPLPPRGRSEGTEKTVQIIQSFLDQARKALQDEEKGNGILLRGFDTFHPLPSLGEIYKFKAAAIAVYPMYKGAARLVGMEVLETGPEIEDEIQTLAKAFEEYDFFYLHVKKTDSYGEDGNFEAKVGVIERVSLLLPKILELQPKVLAITGDHSTPASYCAHSWHPVPLLLNGPFVRYSDQRFTEKDCARGDLGRLPSKSLMPLMVANAGRLKKFGA